MSRRFVNLTGRRFGRWAVVALHPERCRNGGTRWLCRCDCDGTERVVATDLLRGGKSTSCGCAQREAARKQLIDLTGQRFGRWLVLALHSERGPGREALWLCRCNCPQGTERVVRGVSLREGTSTSCGCRLREVARTQLIDLTGKRFGRWTALAIHSERDAQGRILWWCRCGCPQGTERALRGDILRGGGSTSCGCFAREQTIKRNTKHGMSQTRAYHIWENMISRCFNPNNPAYHHYGGRGITVCEYYRSFENWNADRGNPPPGKSNDRINNDGNYELGNCRWATAAEQVRNRRPPKRKRRRTSLAQIQAYADSLARAASAFGEMRHAP